MSGVCQLKKLVTKREPMSSGPPRIPSLSPLEMLIIELLIARGEVYGLELVSASGGKLRRGSVYVTLSRMEEKGYVSFRKEQDAPILGGMPRPLYRATGLGERVLAAWQMMGQQVIGWSLIPS